MGNHSTQGVYPLLLWWFRRLLVLCKSPAHSFPQSFFSNWLTENWGKGTAKTWLVHRKIPSFLHGNDLIPKVRVSNSAHSNPDSQLIPILPLDPNREEPSKEESPQKFRFTFNAPQRLTDGLIRIARAGLHCRWSL